MKKFRILAANLSQNFVRVCWGPEACVSGGGDDGLSQHIIVP